MTDINQYLDLNPGSQTNEQIDNALNKRITTALGPIGGSESSRDFRRMRDRGTSLYDKVAGPGYLEQLRGQRSPEMQGIIGNALDQQKGLESKANAAATDNAIGSVLSQGRGALAQLRASQGASGVRGGLATAQAANQRAQTGQQYADFNRQLLLENVKAKQEGLKNAASIIGNQENVERDMAADRLSTVMGIRTQSYGLKAAELQAEAGSSAGGKK